MNDRPLCEPCADVAVQAPQPGRSVMLTRAVLFGIGAALVGMLLYAGIEILTGWVIGYAAIGVGYLIGKTMKKGSGGRGGRRYQIAAALLTYAAVSLASIPVGIHSYMKQHPTQGTKARSSDWPGRTSAGGSLTHARDSEVSREAGAFGNPIVNLLAMGLASPFLDLSEGVGGLIGLFILFIGIRAAWGLTAGTEVLVSGPYEAGVAPSASFPTP